MEVRLTNQTKKPDQVFVDNAHINLILINYQKD